jgi:hypothetical protein
MPRTPVDYSKTIIYKLVHKEDYDNVNTYIGSTTDFRRRKNTHKTNCNSEKSKEHNQKNYQYIRNNGGWDCFNMIEVEKFPCGDKRQAEAREEYWRCHFNSQLNTRRAYITYEERREQKKEHYEQNKDKISEREKERYEQNKSNILERKKEHYEQNKDDISEKNKEYYEKNKDKLSEKITCECGCILNKNKILRHQKTQKHLMKIGVLKYQFIDDKDDSTECITHQPLQLLLS